MEKEQKESVLFKLSIEKVEVFFQKDEGRKKKPKKRHSCASIQYIQASNCMTKE